MEELSEKEKELIDRYLLGELAHEEEATFEKKKSEKAFAKHLAFVQSAMKVAKATGESELRGEFKKIDAELDGGTGQKRPFYTRKAFRWIIGVIGLGIIVYLLWYLFNPTPPHPDRLYAEFYQPMPNVLAPIEKGAGQADLYSRALQSYERADYEEAVQLFEHLENPDVGSRFYQGLSLLAVGNPELAVSFLESLSQSSDFEFSQAAEWYLALTYLKMEEVEECKVILEAIAEDEEHRYYEEAMALLRKLP